MQDSPENDRRRQSRDAMWKVIAPRWPRSADGQWYWKSDTSSDELDGHYFFYALYHDLVARDDAERAEVAAVVRRITDHLLAHDFTLVDHDGTPTRWGVFGPSALNASLRWSDERGLNSLSMLTYLRIAHHVTSDARYDAAATTLVTRHGYAMNLLHPKVTLGVGGGNQSDDEMAFMNYYHLLKYEQDPVVRPRPPGRCTPTGSWNGRSATRSSISSPRSALQGQSFTTAFDVESLALPDAAWRDDTLDTLRRFPMDLVDHGLENSHRLDLRPIDAHVRPDAAAPLGVRAGDGKVLPVDERMVFHWNLDPYELDHVGTRHATRRWHVVPAAVLHGAAPRRDPRRRRRRSARHCRLCAHAVRIVAPASGPEARYAGRVPLLIVALVALVLAAPLVLLPLSIIQRYRVGTAAPPGRAWVATLNVAGFLLVGVCAGDHLGDHRALGAVGAARRPRPALTAGIAARRHRPVAESLGARRRRALLHAEPLARRRADAAGARPSRLRRLAHVARGVVVGRGSRLAGCPPASPGSLAAGALLIGYGLGFWSAVRWRIDARRLTRSRSRLDAHGSTHGCTTAAVEGRRPIAAGRSTAVRS